MKHKNYDVIVAWASGQTIQYKVTDTWSDVESNEYLFSPENFYSPNFNNKKLEWRIKPQPTLIKYRLALMRHKSEEYYMAVFNSNEYFLIEFINSENFVKWVSDWLETEALE